VGERLAKENDYEELDGESLTKRINGSISSREDGGSILSECTSRNTFMRDSGLHRYISLKQIVIGSFFFSIVGLGWYLRQQGYLSAELLFNFVSDFPLIAPLIFIVCHAGLVLFMIPSLPLNLGAGVLWGPVLGGLIATVGSGLGSIAAFAVARGTLGKMLLPWIDNRMVAWVHNQLETKGWLIVAFVRINPIFPTGPINFAFGLTSIRFLTYTWSTFAFLFPPTLAFSIIGYEVGTFALGGEMVDLVRTIFIVSAVITVVILVSIVVKRIICSKER